ncbi:MAG: hypothetical protein KIC46_02760 [Clostridiales bacterium]|nr:hypothetical protein [Clostridiales bacterium]
MNIPDNALLREQEGIEHQPRAKLKALNKAVKLAEALDFALRVDEL